MKRLFSGNGKQKRNTQAALFLLLSFFHFIFVIFLYTITQVLRHYNKRIRIAAIKNGHMDRETEDSIKQRLVAALFKFRFDEQPYRKTE
jgi:hypothetical protein